MALEESVTAPLRVLELYSGIGGMHAALERAVPGQYNVVSAFDINNIANDIYKHNFPDTKVFQGLIEGIRPDVFARRYQADVYMMSPPCQPYTRTGHQQGIDDSRSKSFVYILNAIRTLEHPPSYILLENVKGFEFSNGRNAIIDVLKERDYTWQEFLLSPDQFGIPNSRVRYFLVAVRAPLVLPGSHFPFPIYHIPTMDGSFHPSFPCPTPNATSVQLPPYPSQVPVLNPSGHAALRHDWSVAYAVASYLFITLLHNHLGRRCHLEAPCAPRYTHTNSCTLLFVVCATFRTLVFLLFAHGHLRRWSPWPAFFHVQLRSEHSTWCLKRWCAVEVLCLTLQRQIAQEQCALQRHTPIMPKELAPSFWRPCLAKNVRNVLMSMEHQRARIYRLHHPLPMLCNTQTKRKGTLLQHHQDLRRAKVKRQQRELCTPTQLALCLRLNCAG
eukprot:m.78276 g.78276  ORF g.78276 m.78276 type:complete len:444 (+) comp12531_c0_seq1:180-1511(+)